MSVNVKISDQPAGDGYSENISLGIGLNYGRVRNGSYTPVINQDLNTGFKALFISHDGTEPIHDVYLWVSAYSKTYGGDRSAQSDFQHLLALGRNHRSRTPNNHDGLGGGIALEFNADGSPDTDFSGVTSRIVGKDGGFSKDNAFMVPASAMLGDSSPRDGVIKPGKEALVKVRLYMPEVAEAGGKFQWDFNLIYTYGV